MGKKGCGKGGRKVKQISSKDNRSVGKEYYKKKRRSDTFNDLNDAEEKQLEEQIRCSGGQIYTMVSDGNCLFRSIADQMEGDESKHMDYRQRIVLFMEGHSNDFSPFMEDDEKWSDYIERMKNDGEWGGHQELVAASRLLQVNIMIHIFNSPRWEILYEGGGSPPTLHLSYHGGSHYNSVRGMAEPVSTAAATAGERTCYNSQEYRIPADRNTVVAKPKRRNKDKDLGIGVGNMSQETKGDVLSSSEDGTLPTDDGNKQNKKAGCDCGSGKKYRKCCRKIEKMKIKLNNGEDATHNEEQSMVQRLQAISI